MNPDPNTDAMVQSHTHSVPDLSIPPKHSFKHFTTSDVSQNTSVVKSKKLARSDVSGRQSRSKDFSPKPLTQMKLQGGVQGVLVMEKETKKMVDEVVPSTITSLKRKAFIHDSDSDDDMPLSSKLKISKEVADTTTASLVDHLETKEEEKAH